jgi:hypothetical protein
LVKFFEIQEAGGKSKFVLNLLCFCSVNNCETNNFAVRLGLAERFCSWRGPDSDPKLARHPSERLGEGV